MNRHQRLRLHLDLALAAFSLSAILVGVWLVLGARQTADRRPPCTCAGKPVEADCRSVRFDVGEGRMATGVIWTHKSGRPLSCLVIPPVREIVNEG